MYSTRVVAILLLAILSTAALAFPHAMEARALHRTKFVPSLTDTGRFQTAKVFNPKNFPWRAPPATVRAKQGGGRARQYRFDYKGEKGRIIYSRLGRKGTEYLVVTPRNPPKGIYRFNNPALVKPLQRTGFQTQKGEAAQQIKVALIHDPQHFPWNKPPNVVRAKGGLVGGKAYMFAHKKEGGDLVYARPSGRKTTKYVIITPPMKLNQRDGVDEGELATAAPDNNATQAAYLAVTEGEEDVGEEDFSSGITWSSDSANEEDETAAIFNHTSSASLLQEPGRSNGTGSLTWLNSTSTMWEEAAPANEDEDEDVITSITWD